MLLGRRDERAVLDRLLEDARAWGGAGYWSCAGRRVSGSGTARLCRRCGARPESAERRRGRVGAESFAFAGANWTISARRCSTSSIGCPLRSKRRFGLRPPLGPGPRAPLEPPQGAVGADGATLEPNHIVTLRELAKCLAREIDVIRMGDIECGVARRARSSVYPKRRTNDAFTRLNSPSKPMMDSGSGADRAGAVRRRPGRAAGSRRRRRGSRVRTEASGLRVDPRAWHHLSSAAALRVAHQSRRMIWTAAATGMASSAPRIPSSDAPASTPRIVTSGLTSRARP